MPLAVAKCTVTVPVVGPLRVTVKVISFVPLLPSKMLTSLIESVGGAASSLRIVPVPLLSEIVALVGAESFRKKVSFDSKVVSPLIVTLTVLLVWPGVNVRSPLLAL